MFSKHKIALVIADIVVCLIGFQFGFWFVFKSGLYINSRPYPIYYFPTIFLFICIFLCFFQIEGLYKYQEITNPIHQIQTLLKAYLKIFATFVIIIFFMKSDYIADSRLTIALSFFMSFFLMLIVRVIIIPRIYFYVVSKGMLKKRVIILGAGEHGSLVCQFLKLNPRSYFKVIGFCDDDPSKVGTVVEGFPVLGSSNNLEDIIKKYAIKEIIIAISNVGRELLLELIDRCKKAKVVIHVVSDLYTEVNERLMAEEFGGLRTYRVVAREVGIVRLVGKRLFDIFGSSLLLIFLSPLFALIAVAIKYDSNGPVFYKGKVVGKNGHVFKAYKFRSMYARTEEKAKSHKNIRELVNEGEKRHIEFMKNFIQGKVKDKCYLEEENRITKVGRILRKYSLDELPQLINVFKGEMSLVGPRFCTVYEYKFYKPWHKRRFQVKPGMTGLWQVRARSEVSYDDMVILDLYYIDNWSFFFDIEILLRTIPVVIYGKGSRIKTPRGKTLKEKIEDLKRERLKSA